MTKLNTRLAKSSTDKTPREWTKHENYMLYSRGFRDGASTRGMRDECKGLIAYDEGYEDGWKAKNKAINAYCKKLTTNQLF